MIQCHTFNSLARLDVHEGGPYVLSQFVGGMAAPLFLFMAGMTFGFQMEGLDRRCRPAGERLRRLLGRAGYLFLVAYLFRISNAIFAAPHPPLRALLRVDILNCMALAMLAAVPLTIVSSRRRACAAALAGAVVAAASPLVSLIDWSPAPFLLREYLAPDRNRFAFFPWASYLAFGISAGLALRRTVSDGLDRLMQWAVLWGLALILSGQYFSNIPYSLYPRSNFWIDSPALVIIRVGLSLVLLAGAYLWTECISAGGWSWVESLGKTSLLVYWVHIILVYGWLGGPWKSALSVGQAAAVMVVVTTLMVVLSVARLRWSAHRQAARAAAVR